MKFLKNVIHNKTIEMWDSARKKPRELEKELRIDNNIEKKKKKQFLTVSKIQCLNKTNNKEWLKISDH